MDRIFDMLMKASAECSSLEAACAELEQVADSNTLREYINKALPVKELSEQERQVNQALAHGIPARMVRTGSKQPLIFMMNHSMANKKARGQ